MASVWKHPECHNWFACFTDRDGKRRKRSTGLRDRKQAQKIAEEWEAIHRGKKSMRQVMRVTAEMTREVMGREIESLKFSDFVARWVASRKGEVKISTHTFYDAKSRRFLKFLADRGMSDALLSDIQREDVLAWRDAEGARISAKTVNHALKLLRMIFKQAKSDGLIADDPTEDVKLLTMSGHRVNRRPFTHDELEAVLRCCDAEWVSMALFGYYTSQRLSDIAMLQWRDLDIERKITRFVQRKTGKMVTVPMHDDLFEHILSMPTPDDPAAPVHAHAFKVLSKDPESPLLSNEFADILVKAGMRADLRKNKNAGGRRIGSELSYHSLRHMTISELQRQGASRTSAGAIAGHKSEAMTQIYTHVEEPAKREAISKLPTVKRRRADDKQPELF